MKNYFGHFHVQKLLLVCANRYLNTSLLGHRQNMITSSFIFTRNLSGKTSQVVALNLQLSREACCRSMVKKRIDFCSQCGYLSFCSFYPAMNLIIDPNRCLFFIIIFPCEVQQYQLHKNTGLKKKKKKKKKKRIFRDPLIQCSDPMQGGGYLGLHLTPHM